MTDVLSSVMVFGSSQSGAFNSDFYVVAMTVMPIYALAFMLPGGFLYKYFGWASRCFEAYMRSHPKHSTRANRNSSDSVSLNHFRFGLYFAPILIFLLAFGEVEIGGLWNVYFQNVHTFESQIILWLFIVASLIVAVSLIIELNLQRLDHARKYCDGCQRVLNAGTRFCRGCGRDTQRMRLMVCAKCQSPIRPDDGFCSQCGDSL